MNEIDVDPKEKDKELVKILKWSITGVFLLWIIAFVVILYVSNWNIAPDAFGESFGSLNALFSSLAFALLIYTALMQRRELYLQRKELEQTRLIFKKQLEIQKKQFELDKEIQYDNRAPELTGIGYEFSFDPIKDKTILYLQLRPDKHSLSVRMVDYRDHDDYEKNNLVPFLWKSYDLRSEKIPIHTAFQIELESVHNHDDDKQGLEYYVGLDFLVRYAGRSEKDEYIQSVKLLADGELEIGSRIPYSQSAIDKWKGYETAAQNE